MPVDATPPSRDPSLTPERNRSIGVSDPAYIQSEC